MLLVTIAKLYKINGGFVPAEPDERNYLEVIRNFRESPLPHFDGIVFYHSPLLFHYFAFLFSFIFDGYFSLRLVSLISSFILGLVLFYYLRTRVNFWVAGISSALFLLFPIHVYYSRLGLMEVLIALLSFSYIAFFHLGWEKRSIRLMVLAGLALGLGMITKYSILPLVGVPPVVFGLEILVSFYKKRSLGKVFDRSFWQRVQQIMVLYFFAGLVFLPVTYFNYTLHPFEFKSQIKQIFALSGRRFEGEVVFKYLTSFPGFFGWLPTVLLLFGVYPMVRKLAKNLPMAISLSLLFYALFRIALFYPRYFVIITPFLVIVMAFGLDFLRNLIVKKLGGVGQFLVVGVLIVSILPGSYLALEASHHTTVEEVGNFVKESNVTNRWVTTNYWPSAFIDQVGYKITWYSNSQVDSATLSRGGLTEYEKIEIPSAEMLGKEGGWVILEDVFSPTLAHQSERGTIADLLFKTQKPVKVFVDTAPNWPYSEKPTNTFSVFKVEPK